MDRGAATLAVVLDVYEGGQDLIPSWTLKEHRRKTLESERERFMSMYLGAAR